MKKYHLFFIVIILLSLSTSCENSKTKNKDIKETKESLSQIQVSGVLLDDGKKWIANPETTMGIRAMLKAIQNHEVAQQVEKLKTTLENEFQMIFQKCTMTGPPHDQLHNYLLPLKEKISALNEKSDPGKILEINNYLLGYDTYFE